MNATANGKQAWSLMVWKLECKTVKSPSNEEIPDGQRTGVVHVNCLRHRVQPTTSAHLVANTRHCLQQGWDTAC